MEIIKVIEDLQIKIKDSNGNIEDMQFIFYETANKLINNSVLQIGDIEIELKELEFYFYDKDKHPDEYTHRDERQTRMGELYVHKINNKYSTNRKRGGIDITFGNKKYYGGILIRGIKIDGKFVAGPANVRQAIAKKLNLIEDIESNFNHEKLQELLDEFYQNQKIKIESVQEIVKEKQNCLYIYSREGLNNEFSKFTYALYRFIDKQYFLEKNKYKGEITNKQKIRAVSFRIYDKKIDEDYNIKKTEEEIENYCNEQTCKYHICYFIESLKELIRGKKDLFSSCL